ncbi:hypothetical protein N3K66_005528 [Trichothecium roseum]|uniref:Uncharacterized protein n=1 Tax=Trichothecium roseum TaxID=47278 RepID=A0ACC0UZS9_9HYPO|nr:hypothetical protein N3K66_005528 [Trichothecium roseum]
MSLSEIRNALLLFSNPSWSGEGTVPTTIVRNITALSSQVAYEERLESNITTLTTTNADTLNGIIQGLLYVPDIRTHPACDTLQYDFIPPSVTRRKNLPPTNYNLVALAPWFSVDCTLAYLASARLDRPRGFIFYKPDNSTNKPQDVDSPLWNLEDNGIWKKTNQYPVFAIPGIEGEKMMSQLSLYSGNLTEIPHSEEITELYGPNQNDYIRIWTEMEIESPKNIPALWSFFLIVIGALLAIIAAVSFMMHYIQRRRRKSLKRRVEDGEVDLEASGIKRLTVPSAHVKDFPLFTYSAEPAMGSAPTTPRSATSPRSTKTRRRHDARSIMSSQTGGSIRSKRSTIGGSVDTTATNFQPACHICLMRFDHRVTIIRELSCRHIYHPECIDEYLIHNSSLCPMCKHCMLPRGYSPKITNGMVRRERALRRLRERVDLDDDDESDDSKETKIKAWGKRFFTSSSPATPPDVPMTPVKSKSTSRISERANPSTPQEDVSTATPTVATSASPPGDASTPDIPEEEEIQSQAPPRAKKPSRPHKSKPRALRILPTQPENSELRTAPARRGSPSSFARERMREIAAKNAPFDDPDKQRAIWRRAIGHVFPGFS